MNNQHFTQMLRELKKEEIHLLFILVISYIQKQTEQYINGKFQASFIPNHRCKNPKGNNASNVQKNHDQIKFNPRIQDWFEIMKSINVIYHIKEFKEKKNVYTHNYFSECR